MRICITADFHGNAPPEIPGCDLLLFAGDLGMNIDVFGLYLDWLDDLNGRDIPVIGVAGNHDFNSDTFQALPWTYLENSAETIADLKVWGSPLSPPFLNWAHMRSEEELAKVYSTIPEDTDIIISHGPPRGYGDQVLRGPRVGSEALANRALELPRLRLIACGHIHEGYGQYRMGAIQVVNGAWLDHRYKPGNPPIMVEL